MRPARVLHDAVSAATGGIRHAARPARLLLAAKTAAAVAIAWSIAPLVPGSADDYPYYAPLGALISMYPTLMGSLRSSVQTLLGLAVGIGLAVVIVLTIGPSVWTIGLAVGLGVLLSGTGWFGSGSEYLPIAAMFRAAARPGRHRRLLPRLCDADRARHRGGPRDQSRHPACAARRAGRGTRAAVPAGSRPAPRRHRRRGGGILAAGEGRMGAGLPGPRRDRTLVARRARRGRRP